MSSTVLVSPLPVLANRESSLSSSPAEPQLARERPDQPEVLSLIEALDAFQSELYPAGSSKTAQDVEALLRPEVRFLVVRDEQGEVQGCGAIVLREDCAELKRMMVRPEARGRGFGRALIAALEVEAVCAGRPLLRLETGVRQRPAIRLYEGAGYRRCGPFAGYRAAPFSVYMEKLLG